MEVVFLGTGAEIVRKRRGLPCTAIRFFHDGSIWLFDCGEGTQHRFLRTNLSQGKIEKIFFTSLSSDHIFGLPGLMCSIGHNQAINKQPVDLYGPAGIRRYLRRSMLCSFSRMGIRFRTHEVLDQGSATPSSSYNDPARVHPDELEGEDLTLNKATGVVPIFENDRFVVTAVRLKHPIPTLGYVVLEKDAPGRLDIERCTALGVPFGPLLGRLKSGQNVELPDGTLVKSSDVVGPPLKGRKIVVLGRTSDVSSLSPVAKNASLIIFEGALPDCEIRKALAEGNLTSGMMGAFSKQINAERVVLARFSPAEDEHMVSNTPEESDVLLPEEAEAVAVADGDDSTGVNQQMLVLEGSSSGEPVSVQFIEPSVLQLLEEARSAFGASSLDAVIAAQDYMTLDIPRIEPAALGAKQ
eukprot:tig00000863_g4982.t1